MATLDSAATTVSTGNPPPTVGSDAHSPAGGAEGGFEASWRSAVLAVARAQAEYERLLADPDAEDHVVSRGWLALYRAQQKQAELLRAA